MRRRVLNVTLNGCGSLISGHGSRELVIEVTGRSPMWVSRLRGWSVQESTARDVMAAAEIRNYDVEIQGPRSRRAQLLDILMAAPAPRWAEEPDPAAGRW